ncbi:MAG: 5-formyltetrahydrofolate cyclo-ligase [Verrucomicrobiota bacterium]
MISKAEIRKRCFEEVRRLGEEQRRQCSSLICDKISQWPDFLNAKHVFTYESMLTEPSLSRLMEQFPEKAWSFSRISERGRLAFHQVSDRSRLVRSRWGFAEPDPERCPLTSIKQADLILVPGVAFDTKDGTRLGRGKGHYDRYLAPFTSSGCSALLTGVCFAVQLANLCGEPHDVPMHRVITENGISLVT